MMPEEPPPSPLSRVTYVTPEAAPNDAFRGPEFDRRGQRRNMREKKSDNDVLCTACGKFVEYLHREDDIYSHPVLAVVTCRKCYDFYHTGTFTQDEQGSDEYCKWCGEGGNLVCCDFCSAAFCNYCIKRNFSKQEFQEMRDMPEWRCFVCDASSLRKKVLECKALIALQSRHFEAKRQNSMDNNSEMFQYLTENNKRIDDIIGPLETTNLKVAENGVAEAEKKVCPIRILREKENYIVRSRSRSPPHTASSSKNRTSGSLSDPESRKLPTLRFSLKNHEPVPEAETAHRQSSFRRSSQESEQPQKATQNKVTEATEQDATGQRQITPSPEPLENGTDSESVWSKNMMSTDADLSELTLTSSDSTDDEFAIDDLVPDEISDIHIEAVNGPVKPTPPVSADGSDDSSQVEGDVTMVEAPTALEEQEAPSVQDADVAHPGGSGDQSASKKPTYREVVRRAESCIGDLTALLQEVGRMNSVTSASEGSAVRTPTQFSKFRMTSKILKRVKRMHSTMTQLEDDLHTQKEGLRKYRPNYITTDSDASTDEGDSAVSVQHGAATVRGTKTLFNEKENLAEDTNVTKHASDPDVATAGVEIFPDAVQDTAPPEGAVPKPISSGDSTPDEIDLQSISAAEKIKLSAARVLVEKLTPEILQNYLSSQSEVRTENGGDDSDSSKAAFRPGVGSSSSASSDFENFESRINRELGELSTEDEAEERPDHRKRVKKLEKRKTKKRVIASGDETDISDEPSTSDDRAFSNSLSPLKTTPQKKSDDNEIAMNMLFQKMDNAEPCDTDSDVDELLLEGSKVKKDEKSPDAKEKPAELNGGPAADENADDADQDPEEDKTEGQESKPKMHPLLNKRWRTDEDEPGASKEEHESKRKKVDTDHDDDKTVKRKLDMENESVPSESDLTTDSEGPLVPPSQKKTAGKKRKRRAVLSDSSRSSDDVLGDERLSGTASAAPESDNESDDDSEDDVVKIPTTRSRARKIARFGDEAVKVKQERMSDGEEGLQRQIGRKNIRKIIDDNELSQSTKLASQEESMRRKRLEKERTWEEENEEVIVIDDESQTPVKKVVTSRLTLSRTPLIEVHKELLNVLKPHQLEGIRFMWDNLIEKVSIANSKPGNGCILAHCMGLGKTLQVVTFLYTVLMSKHLPKLKSALVLCPFSTVHNWVHEFKKWLANCGFSSPVDFKFGRLPVSELHSAKSNHDRAQKLRHWTSHGGVMVIGYGLYRTLMSDKKRTSCTIRTALDHSLYDPGPDILICDEGHILKNATSNIAILVQNMKSRRRIVLTGTPLQNNMSEYHCMVSLVKPSLLGTVKEFKNRFMNPIENGQHVDSTERDVKLMKKRAHVLHELLAGCVQRKDYSCLRSHLPPKYEYVLSVRLSDLQIRMYQHYLARHSSDDVKFKKGCLFKDFNTLLLLVCHPRCLVLQKERADNKPAPSEDLQTSTSHGNDSDGESSGDETIIISDDEDSDGSDDFNPKTEDDLHGMSSRKLTRFIEKNRGGKVSTTNRKKLVDLATRYLDANFHKTPEFEESLKRKPVSELRKIINENNGNAVGCTEKTDLIHLIKSLLSKKTEETEWFERLLPTQENLVRANSHSGKIVLMLEILHGATVAGDKVVIFSQSILTLNLIEEVLKLETKEVSKGLRPKIEPYSKWVRNVDYYRLDGSTPGNLRDRWIREFNHPAKRRGRVFLISTRAGGMGVNLVGANRAIVFDASWNPSHDIQSIFRIYRFGQEKPCYVYRFIAQGTMEEKIYERQVVKQSLAFRVIDEQQILRHFSAADIAELYNFKPAPKPAPKRDKDGKEIHDDTPGLAPPRDSVLASIIKSVATRDMIVSYHEHDSLLDHQVSEELTEAERKAAWEEYDIERKRNEPPSQNDYMASLTPAALSQLSRVTEVLLEKVQKKFGENRPKTLSQIGMEIRLANRAIDTDTLSRLAVAKKLEHKTMQMRLLRMKRYLLKKKEELQRYYMLSCAHPQNMSNPPQAQPYRSVPRLPAGATPVRLATFAQTQAQNMNYPRASTSFAGRGSYRPNMRPPMANPNPYAGTSVPSGMRAAFRTRNQTNRPRPATFIRTHPPYVPTTGGYMQRPPVRPMAGQFRPYTNR